MLTALLLPLITAGCGPKIVPEPAAELLHPDLARRSDVVDTLHGVAVADPYRWMEEGGEELTGWTDARNQAFSGYTDALPQRAWLYDRMQQLWRYDDESTPKPCLLSERVLYYTKAADQDKWVVHLKERADAEAGGSDDRVILDPNTWEQTDTLAGVYPSPDCRYLVYGVASGGDEDAKLTVMDLDSLEPLDDTFRGWKLGGVSWLHDNSGFYYSSKPLEEEVAPGEHFYWHRALFHALGDQAADDEIVFADDEVKETWHGVSVTEDGRWLVRSRGMFNKNAVWVKPVDGGEWRALTDAMDAQYSLQIIDDVALITTDWGAPKYRVMRASLEAPAREGWEEFIPEGEDTLSSLAAVGGHLYAIYEHNAATRIVRYGLDGSSPGELTLPTVGSGGVYGYWSKPETRVSFASYAHPSTLYTYDPEADALTLLKASRVPVAPELVADIEAEQIWYPSADGTEVSMFIIHREGMAMDSSTPFLLTGYGGFNISMSPRFSTLYTSWLEAGGAVAVPNLRGGGEYGQAWHEAGMREKKQNVFDDFIAAAEHLLSEGYTAADRLAISGGSNGGLLVSAAVVQRPELFQAVLCTVPLTDMVRYHRFGLANIWSEEYGNADDPEMFPHLLAYSPYHNVRDGTDYPAILVTGSVNDARTDPIHAMKFSAAARWADADHGDEEPILLHIQSDSGHGGGVGIDTQADQVARHYGFLMAQIGLTAPAATPADAAAPAAPEVAE